MLKRLLGIGLILCLWQGCKKQESVMKVEEITEQFTIPRPPPCVCSDDSIHWGEIHNCICGNLQCIIYGRNDGAAIECKRIKEEAK